MYWFQIGKGVHHGCILSPCLFNLYAEYIMRNARLDETQAGIKIAGRNISNLRNADDTTLMAESEEELKSLFMKVKEWKSWLKAQHSKNEDHSIWSHHFMVNRWETSISALLTMPKPLTVEHNKLWRILQDMGIPDHIVCLLRNLYAGQEAIVRTGHGENVLVPNWERSPSRLYIVTLLI